MPEKKFDYTGERAYYARPVTQVRDWKWMAQDARLWIPGFPDILRGKSVLDIGAGECFLTFAIAESGQARCTVGLELVLHRMQAARQVHLAGLRLVCGDCFQLPFGNGVFDVVVGNGVLHHLPDEESAIAEIVRVLKPGGSYFGREPNFRNPLVRQMVLGGHRSPNEHAVSLPQITSSFAREGLTVRFTPFWRRLPWLHSSLFSISVAIAASSCPNP